MILNYFAQQAPDHCGNCDNCLDPPQVLEVTEAAKKFVSCLWRCTKASGHGYGAGHIIAVLRGETTERILARGHDKLSTFGIGRDLDEEIWHRVLRQLIVQGYIDVDVANYSILAIRPEAKEFLKGDKKLFITNESAHTRKKASRTSAEAEMNEEERKLFNLLRGWRREEALRQGVPPYIIFPDSTLHEIVRMQPTDVNTLADVQGMGEKRLECYGSAVLAVVADFLKNAEKNAAAAS